MRLDCEQSAPSSIGFSDFRSNYIFNSTLNGVEDADALLIVGCNPRHEAAVLNARIRKAWLAGLNVAVVGDTGNLNYEFDAIRDLKSLPNHAFMRSLRSAKRPMIIVGSSVLESAESSLILNSIAQIVEDVPNLLSREWNGYNLLHRVSDTSRNLIIQAASWTAALDIGFKTSLGPIEPKVVYLLNADDYAPGEFDKSFVVYQGHHGDLGAKSADVVLPGCVFSEKNATFVNTEGRSQATRAAVTAPGAARDDWKIIRALSEYCGVTLPYNDINDVRGRMSDLSPNLVEYDTIGVNSFTSLGLASLKTSPKQLFSGTVSGFTGDFYLSNAICRASATMAKCSRTFTQKEEVKEERLLAV